MRTALTFVFLLTFPLFAAPTDPGLLVEQARDHISGKRYIDAISALKGALKDVEKLSPAERTQAEAAVHFYSAVAHAGMREDADANAHLKQFFSLVPNAKLSAPQKYDPHFVDLFRNTQPRDANAPLDENATFRFDHFYPGYRTDTHPAEDHLMWGAAISILATPKEKRQWESTLASADREQFMDAFWKKRDAQPETPINEFRDTFLQRVAFADYAFGAPDERGATSDRGRVFVLLGAPSSVHRRPLTPLDGVQIVDRTTVLNGLVEQWVYPNTQLPVKIAKKYVGYRFVTQEGIGENVMQREEPYAIQALMFAMNPNDAKRKN